MAFLEVYNLHKSYGTHEVLKGINASINAGDVISIIGPSGSGKSTFLRCLNHLEVPTSGTITYDGQIVGEGNITHVRQSMGMVFQHFNLFPHLSVLENLTLAPIKALKLSRDEAIARATLYLDKVGLLAKRDVMPSSLSGGQAQRVAIARALCNHPNTLLFDEPTSALDPEMIKEVLDVIKDLLSMQMTLLIVTHEMGFAKSASNMVYFVDNGLIVEREKASVFFDSPKSQRARDFLNKVLNH